MIHYRCEDCDFKTGNAHKAEVHQENNPTHSVVVDSLDAEPVLNERVSELRERGVVQDGISRGKEKYGSRSNAKEKICQRKGCGHGRKYHTFKDQCNLCSCEEYIPDLITEVRKDR